MLYKSTLEGVHLSDIQYLVFDKDETITPANAPITEPMAHELSRLMKDRYVCILTARDYGTCQQHILDPYKKVFENYENKLILACCNGSEIYRYSENQQRFVQDSVLIGELCNDEIFENLVPLINETIQMNTTTYERRSKSMASFSCMPAWLFAPEVRKSFDPDKSIRQKVIAKIQELIPPGYEILPGGSTSIDVGLYNKEKWMRHIMQYFQCPDDEKIVYFGDNFNGGNDAPIQNIENIVCVEVTDYEDTLRLIKTIH